MIAGGLGLLALGSGAHAQVQTKTPDSLEIERLLYRYALAIDNRDSPALVDCFAAGVMTPEVAEKTMEFHRLFEYTVHNVLNPSYTVRERDATGMHYSVVSYVKNTDGRLTKFDTYARYEDDQLVKQDGQWRFSRYRRWKATFSTAEVPVVKNVPPGFSEAFREIFSRGSK